ncbi:TolC family protein, partial [bacterium]|nr:TolC family protein [bacterium]
NNLDLEIAQLDPRIASVLVNEERAKFDDLIFARAKYGKKYTPRLSGDLVTFKTKPGSILEGQEARLIELPEKVNTLELDAGITVPLRTGGRFAVSAPFSQKNALTDIPSDQWLSALRFSVSQPLLRDAGVATNVASIRIAEYDRRATDVKTRLQAIRVLATIDKSYWSVFGAWAELDVRRQQYENARNNLNLVRQRVGEGISPAVEVNRAEVGVAERLESLVQAETALKLRERQLKLYLNSPDLELGAAVLLVPETRPQLVRYDFDREALVRQALEGRLELLELELKLASDLVKIDYLENQTLPIFTLEYSYAPLGQSGDGFGSSWNDTFGGPYDEWFVGGRFEIPLTNLARRSKLERAILEREQRLASRKLREVTVRREIFDALDQLQQNWQRILAARQNVLVAGINYEAELVQFREGLRTMTEVLEALTRLGEAQVREIKAIVDYQVAQIDLAFATGTLLGYTRVYLPGGPSLPVDTGALPPGSSPRGPDDTVPGSTAR